MQSMDRIEVFRVQVTKNLLGYKIILKFRGYLPVTDFILLQTNNSKYNDCSLNYA